MMQLWSLVTWPVEGICPDLHVTRLDVFLLDPRHISHLSFVELIINLIDAKTL
jgi:hypothetical protein